VARAVLLLVRPGEFVLADHVVEVVVGRGATNDAHLPVRAHFLGVDIIGVLPLLDHVALVDQLVEVLRGHGIDLVVVEVDRRVKVDFRLDHVEEGEGIAAGHLPRLLGVDHIVGRRGDLFGQFRPGP